MQQHVPEPIKTQDGSGGHDGQAGGKVVPGGRVQTLLPTNWPEFRPVGKVFKAAPEQSI